MDVTILLYLCGYVQTERRDKVVSKLASLSQTRVVSLSASVLRTVHTVVYNK